MNESILQAYLNEQHIKTDVQENIDNLNKAVKEIEKLLTRKREKPDIISYILVALDPKIKDADPVVQLVEMTIIKKWPAFKNSVAATQDKSTTYVRAVILESLSQLSKENDEVAALVWLTARDVIEYYQLDAEEHVIRGLLQGLADRVEENGRAAWGINHKLQMNKFEGAGVSIPAIKAAQVDEEALKIHLLNAMVHSGWSQHAGGGQNPQVQSNANWQWPKFAAENSASGIAQVVSAALSQQAKNFSAISSSIQSSLVDYFSQIQPFIEDLSSSVVNSVAANNKRSSILWWKQSLYSRSLNDSYRNLDRLSSVICMAYDLADQVEPIYPESLDYLLRETVKDVHKDQEAEECLLVDWLTDSLNLQENIQSLLKLHVAQGEQRKPLLNAWANALNSGNTANFFEETGIDKNAKLIASDLAVWLFHGFQAQKLTANN